jgi:acetyltransferase EpsM
MSRKVALIGYSGHAYVVLEALRASGRLIAGYCEPAPRAENPYGLAWLGNESDPDVRAALASGDYIICVGDNALRARIYRELRAWLPEAAQAIHPAACVSPSARLGDGAFVAALAQIGPLARVGTGAICNTGSIIEHECEIGPFAHVAPGAVLAGNVRVGEGTLVGAGAVVIPGIRIGDHALVGAGTVVIRDIADRQRVAGNPQRVL